MTDWTAAPGPGSLDKKEPGYTHGPRRKQETLHAALQAHPSRGVPPGPWWAVRPHGSPPAGHRQTAGLAWAASDWEVPLTCPGPVLHSPTRAQWLLGWVAQGQTEVFRGDPWVGPIALEMGALGVDVGKGPELVATVPSPQGASEANSAPLPAAALMVAIQTPERPSWGASGTRAPTPATPGPAPADSVLTPAGSQTASRRCRTRRGGPRSSGR